jgi:glycosyltransferase involved in cell wall biosynthesis
MHRGSSRNRSAGGRLGVYVDDVYRVLETTDGEQVSVDRAFLLFACEVGRHFDGIVLFGRTVRSGTPADYVLPRGVELVELPHYAKLDKLGQVARAAFGTATSMWRGLRRVDVVWVLGPHPFSLILIPMAFLRRRKVVLGVRQNTMGYYRARLPSKRWKPVLLAIWSIEMVYRLLARVVPTTAVGTEVAARYGGPRGSLLTMTASVMRERDVVGAPAERDWSGAITLLTVGRLEPEKNPFLLVEALARLEREEPGRFRVVWIGRGELEEALRARARELGVEEMIDLRGYVPFGRELLELYRTAHVFVHVSLTEGVPQVLIEALASGTPIVATDVGGIASTLDDGTAALLVAPNDVDGLVAAIQRIKKDGDLRERLTARGLELARDLTLERQAESVARFLRSS